MRYDRIRYDEEDPLEKVDFVKYNGKIEVTYEDATKKFKYYIVPLKGKNDYFKGFDWTAKGVVRKRFEAIQRRIILKKGTKPKELKEAIKEAKEACKSLESLVGPLTSIREEL